MQFEPQIPKITLGKSFKIVYTYVDTSEGAIRISKEMQTKRSEFEIRPFRDEFVLFPKDDPWFPLRQSIGTLLDDFMIERGQLSCANVEKREEM